jgi:hypothetical protein
MIQAAKAEVEQIERQISRLSSTPNNNQGALHRVFRRERSDLDRHAPVGRRDPLGEAHQGRVQ